MNLPDETETMTREEMDLQETETLRGTIKDQDRRGRDTEERQAEKTRQRILVSINLYYIMRSIPNH